MQGEALPPPAYADYEMAEIILKAAAFRPQDRWQSPEEMGQALVSYMQRNPVNDAIIAPPVVTPAVLDAEAMAPDTQGAAQPAPSQPDQVGSEPQPSAESDSPAEVEAPPEPAAEPEPEPAAEPEPESPAEAEPLPAEEPRQEIPAEAPDAAQPEPADNPLQAMKAILSQEEPSAEDSAPAEPEEDEAFPQEEEQNLSAAPQDPELADILSRAESFLTSPSGEDTPEPDAAQPPAPPPQPEAPAEEEGGSLEEAPRRRSWKGLIVFCRSCWLWRSWRWAHISIMSTTTAFLWKSSQSQKVRWTALPYASQPRPIPAPCTSAAGTPTATPMKLRWKMEPPPLPA